EALLAHDDGSDVVEPSFPDEAQALLRLAPHRVERIVPQEKKCDGLVHAVASEGQITRLNRGAKSRPHEIDRGLDWLCPVGNYSHRMVGLRLVGDKAVLLDKVAGEFGESIPLAVTVKDRAEDKP